MLAGLKAEGINPRGYIIEIGASKRKKKWWWGHPEHDTSKERPDLRLISGLGVYRRKWIRLGIPKAWWSRDLARDEVEHLAQVAVHEFGHNLDLHHEDMVRTFTIPVPWVGDLPVRLAEVKAKPKRDLVADRAARAEAKLKEHEGGLRRKQRLVQKYRKRVGYYRKALAARKAANK